MTETARLRTGFFTGIALLLCLGAAIIVRTNALTAGSRRITHTNQVLGELHGVALASSEAENAFRRFSSSGNDADLTVGRTALDTAEQHERALEKLVPDNPVQVNNLVFVRELLRRHVTALRQGPQALAELDQTTTGRDLLATVAHMSDEEQRLLKERTEREAGLIEYSRYVFFAAALAAFGLLIVGGNRMTAARRLFAYRALEISAYAKYR